MGAAVPRLTLPLDRLPVCSRAATEALVDVTPPLNGGLD